MKYGLLGNKINYSLSPLIYEYWFYKYNLKASYDLIDININTLTKGFITDLFEHKKYKAVNITKPFKESCISLINSYSDEIKFTKAINNIFLENNLLKGYNTDYLGLLDSFKFFNIDIKNKNILILGAGGTAKSLIYALKQTCGHIFVQNRTKDKALQLKELFNLEKLQIVSFEDEIDTYNLYNKKIDIIFNCASSGIEQYLQNINLKENIIFYDVNYHENILLDGVKSYNGLMMLIFQAAHNFKLWFNFFPEINDEIICLLKKAIK